MGVRRRRRRSLHHGVVHVAIVAAVTRVPGVVMMVLLLRLRLRLLRLRLVLVQRGIVHVVMMVPAVQRARARLIIIVMMMPGAR